jgi:pilus assembly protein CpaC
MNSGKITRRARLGTALAALAVALGTVGAAAPAQAQSQATRPSETLTLSAGTGTLVRLSEPMSDVFVAKDAVADVQVRSSTQLYVFGKSMGETTIYATSKSGRVDYAANVRVANNVGSMNEMLHMAMPEARIQATSMNNLVLLTGSVASPDDVEIAQRLVENYVGGGIGVVNRIRTATPLQVMLKVRIAEMNRTALKQVGVNLLNRDSRSGHLFGIGQGSPGSINVAKGPADPITGVVPETVIGATFNNIVGGTTLGLFGHIFGTDLLGTLDLLQKDGLVSTLAEPNLTALSGETASFLAGGEFPIPVSQSLGAITIEYKQYGVGLAFTPVVLDDGRISMRVRPEVSELSNEGSIKLNNFVVPALTTRRAETTVELGSGQSFMIAGLLRNHLTNDINKAPFLGDLPVLGSLFRSTAFRRDETELVIIVTPYLVRPVSNHLATPVDGFRAPNDAQEVFMGQTYTGVGVVPTANAAKYPGASAAGTAPVAAGATRASGGAVAAPGFKL